jgi:hypothetical protein
VPKIVWSIDFELRWGVHDVVGLNRDAYRGNLEGARVAVPRLLDLFAGRGVRATWATVGALACRNWDEYFQVAPPAPRYASPRLAVDPRYADLDPDGILHFAPDLVLLISQTNGQDLGSHTFSHLFLGEVGVMRSDAQADHAAITALFLSKTGRAPTSLVFPRNQVAFLNFFRSNGVTAWRENESNWYHRLTQHAQHPLLRARRLVDALTPWSTHGGNDRGGCSTSTGFVRVMLPEPAWRVHLAKIANEARRMKKDTVLHFWLHPHNLGGDVSRGLARMSQVLDVLDKYAPKETVKASMRDLTSAGAAVG